MTKCPKPQLVLSHLSIDWSLGLGHWSFLTRLRPRKLPMRRAARALSLSGFRGRRTGALGRCGGAGGVETPGESASLAAGGVLVDRVLGRDLVQPLGHVAQFRLGLLEIAAAQGAQVRLDLVLEQVLAGAVSGAALDALTDSLLGGQ